LDPTLPRALDTWFTRACARDIADRFQSAKEMVDALAAAITGEARTSGVASSSGSRPAVTDPSGLAFANTAVVPSSQPMSSDTNAGIHSEARTGNAASVRTSSRRPLILGAAALVLGAIAAVAVVGASANRGHEPAAVSDRPVELQRPPVASTRVPDPIAPVIEPPIEPPLASAVPTPSVTSARHVRRATNGGAVGGVTGATGGVRTATQPAVSAPATTHKPREGDPDDIK
ncbi:MAG: Serine/threonine protein kinase PrkC, regulator of stationary phase, partial [Myxococcaceae bacterium]|nr:Serine/threonine protein kinase PrkC, regulator of stationary phase [Myxococcaceae bacterium]